MKDYKLDRRRTLLGLVASASGCMLPRQMRAAPAVAGPHAIGIEDGEARDRLKRYIRWLESPEQQALCHAPFQAEFLAWLAESAHRFALPVSTYELSGATEFNAAGLHPALMISLWGRFTINVSVFYNGRCVTFVSMLVNAEQVADGVGWCNSAFLPQVQRIHATREACWREDCFEVFLDWFNNDLAPATHVALYGEDGDDASRWSIVRLLRDGHDARTGRPGSAGFLRALLPTRAPVSATASDTITWATSDSHVLRRGTDEGLEAGSPPYAVRRTSVGVDLFGVSQSERDVAGPSSNCLH